MAKQETLAANIAVHSRLADAYDSTEPHFRPENQAKVRSRLEALRKSVPGGRLIDIGCGTGFIIHLAADLFDEVHGIDITTAMMAKVRKDLKNVTLHECSAENLKFADGYFDAATAYSFIDHLDDPGAVLKEAARVLKPGGVFYMDLIPNRLFWVALQNLASTTEPLSDIVTRELKMVTANAEIVERDFGIDSKTFIAAEPGKKLGGIEPFEFRETALRAGFSKCEIHFDWFLGQGAVMHQQSFEEAGAVDRYLKRASPLANHLYKYLYFVATR